MRGQVEKNYYDSERNCSM